MSWVLHHRCVRILLLVLVTTVTKGARILLLTTPVYSHCLEIAATGHGLVEKGHDVSILFGSNFEPKDCHQRDTNGTGDIKVISKKDNPTSVTMGNLTARLTDTMVGGREFSLLENFGMVTSGLRSMCDDFFYDASYIQVLKDRKFDLVILDGFFMNYCSYIVPYKLGVPYISGGSFFEYMVCGRPFLPTILPSRQLKFTDNMSFFQRMQNGAHDVMFHYFLQYLMPDDLISQFDPQLSVSRLIDLAAKSELFLHNFSPILNFPAPTMPNIIEVGGICALPAKPLEGNFKDFYSRSKSVILVTFGSSFGKLPQKIEERLLKALTRLDFDVLWKYNDESQERNVKRVKWLPQNDLLGHPKTVLFISHCGNNGLYEALYHGVPVLCTPLFGDQFHNSIRVKHWDVGGELVLLSSTEDEMFNTITELLRNPKYGKNMKQASKMFHDQPFTPREKSTFWIEHILQFGGSHLRSRASEMSTFTYMGYDIFCFLFFTLFVVVFVLIKSAIFCCNCKCCCRARHGKQKTQ